MSESLEDVLERWNQITQELEHNEMMKNIEDLISSLNNINDRLNDIEKRLDILEQD